MPKLSKNPFLNAHPNPILVGFDFAGYTSAKKASKNKPIIFRSGKTLPAPTAVVTALASHLIKGDYCVGKRTGGAFVMLADLADAATIQKEFRCSPFSKSNPPFSGTFRTIIEMELHISMAEKLGLL